jgi:hypothetical protein
VHEQLDRQLPRSGDDRRAHGEGLGERQLVEQRLAGSQLEAAQEWCGRAEGRGGRAHDRVARVEREVLDADLDHRP